MTDPTGRLVGPVHVVGAGLLGTSIGLAATDAGLEVWLSDTDEEHVRTAVDMGAGTPPPPAATAQLVVVAVPPSEVADVVVEALRTGAVVTDVASVKEAPLDAVADRAGDGDGFERYVGSHPMAGSERSGPLGASAALFDGRPWAVTPHPHSDPEAVRLVKELVRLCGAVPVMLSPAEHDLAVARTSHLPHLAAALVAGLLADVPAQQLSLCGQGVRDVTRIAGGDVGMWGQIIRANRAAVADMLADLRVDLDGLITALADDDPAALEEVLARGRAGTRAISLPRVGRPAGAQLHPNRPAEATVLTRAYDADVTQTHVHHSIDYVEFAAPDIEAAKRFYDEAFGWSFNDYGPDYAGIRSPDGEGEIGGLNPSRPAGSGLPLVILYSDDLEATLAAVRGAGAQITEEPFEFPGGRRFHFTDPGDNELAVWTATE